MNKYLQRNFKKIFKTTAAMPEPIVAVVPALLITTYKVLLITTYKALLLQLTIILKTKS